MSITKTSAELIAEAATDIGALSPNEVLSSEDYATFDSKLDGLLETLNEDEELYFPDKEEIPFAAFLPLARLLGNVAGSAVVGAPLNDAAWERDVRALRRVYATKPTYQTTKAEYF